jgi:hypothetical protein
MEGGGEVSDTEYPHCGCADFWPGQGHHPDCPVRHKFETLERENAAMREQLARICAEGFDNQDTIGLEPADDYVLRQLAVMREAIREAHDVLKRVATEAKARTGFQCGCPDMVTMYLKADVVDECRVSFSKLQPFLKP